ncbi:hypothetical protein H6G76_31415 [Nostoc sp. FACHB-152]|uniref:hypothetical protein n=1 Tax=unclassified Nostoc TaxID=2593658 RepID=UPI001689597F|nr:MULTISPECIES: hypothetical protein [unclassified Nostoc]MBD2451548.1 hypothetical protein [Nostoc sp. FACHB-152]MBD2466395.1 hypothetical protein [Nostoc sp. FACHB-145]
MQNILSNFVKATTLSLGLLLTTPVLAQQAPAPVINGISHPRESSFFREGRERFEKEIQILAQRRSLSATILKIRLQKIERHEKRSPNNQPQALPSDKP